MTVPVVEFVVGGRTPDTVRFDRPWTVVYDGNCNVCGRLANVLRDWDRREQLTIVPSQTPGVRARFPWIPAGAYEESLQLIGPGGHTWQGAAAVERLLEQLPKGRLVSWIFRIPFMRPLAERAYRWFARHRYRFGCGDHCQSRPPDLAFPADDVS